MLLMDAVLRELLRPHSFLQRGTKRRTAELADVLSRARRFVLDDRMSELVADISIVPLQGVKRERRDELMTSIRHGARLPYPIVWIEFSGRAFRRRHLQVTDDLADVVGDPLGGPDSVPKTWGWLLEEHPTVRTAVKMTEFVDNSNAKEGEPMLLMTPFEVGWQTTDDPLPWNADRFWGGIATGTPGLYVPQVGVMNMMERFLKPGADLRRIVDQSSGDSFEVPEVLVELAGLARYAMCFLSTLNDIPLTSVDVKPTKGFVARGRYRKYLSHATIQLRYPGHDTQKLAKRLVAAVRRRAHSVRGHWRLYQRGDGELCSSAAHIWGPADERGHSKCASCTAWRTWIEKHDRGDASLGYVTHDYEVKGE